MKTTTTLFAAVAVAILAPACALDGSSEQTPEARTETTREPLMNQNTCPPGYEDWGGGDCVLTSDPSTGGTTMGLPTTFSPPTVAGGTGADSPALDSCYATCYVRWENCLATTSASLCNLAYTRCANGCAHR